MARMDERSGNFSVESGIAFRVKCLFVTISNLLQRFCPALISAW